MKNIVVVGAGVAGRLLERDIARRAGHRVVGFVDDRPVRSRTVLGGINDLGQLTTTHRIDEIVVAIPSADGSVMRRVLLANVGNTVPILTVPREAWVLRRDDVSYEAVRALEVEEWLGRPLHKGAIRRLERFYEGKVVVVTGGAGSIGSEIVRQLLDYGAKRVVVYDNSEYLLFDLEQRLLEEGVGRRRRLVLGDVTNVAKVEALMAKVKPDLVFHTAAYKHVHLMEENVDEAVRVNVLGTRAVITAAEAVGAHCLFVSTDKAVNPTSVMGATKRIAECYVQDRLRSGGRSNIVRFGNVINSRGSVLPLWDEQIRTHRYVTVTDKRMRRFFMSIREAAHLVLASAMRSSRGAIYVLDMGDLISVKDVAQCLIRSRNLRPGVDVQLKLVGRRRGEKLTEELFTRRERRQMRRTSLANVWQLRREERRPFDSRDVIRTLEGMLAKQRSDRQLRAYLERLFESLS